VNNLIKKIQNTIFQYSLVPRGSRIVLGVSGGPDSVCLLNIFVILQKKYDLDLLVAHVNYNLREKDSQRDEQSVKKLAEKFGLRFVLLAPKTAKKSGEEPLRKIRYDFFEKIRKENDFDLIAVAHNSDDQVETFLMRVIRGAGLQGLSAMKYKNERIIRPLLGISRKEILEFLKKNKISFRLDKTNRQSIFFRNKIRNKLLPYLEKNFNSNIKQTISNSLESIREDYDLISELAKRELAKNKELRVSKLLELHPALQKRVLREVLEQKKSSEQEITSAHINELLKIIKSVKNKQHVFRLGNLKVERKRDRIVVTNQQN